MSRARSALRAACGIAASLVGPAAAGGQPTPTAAPPIEAAPAPGEASASAEAPAPREAPPPTATADDEVDDGDLAALGLDTDEANHRLNLYGFMDFSWIGARTPGAWATILPAGTSFGVGNLNLYATRALSDRWRSFLEVRFTYAPAGATNGDGTLVHTTAPDPANAGRPMTWGGVAIERASLEYDATEGLTITAGTFLTPYGIWNVDHGSPTIIPIIPPWIVGEELFPKQQTGVHVHGTRPSGEYTVGYHATLTNGRGPFQAFRDLDDNKAIGGRLDLTTPWLGSTRIGVSGYRGRYTDHPATRIVADELGNLEAVTPIGTSYDEWSAGADLLIERGALRVQAEVLANERAYRPGARAPGGVGFLPDSRFVGGYLLAGYRLDRWWQLMPFAMVEIDRPRIDPDLGDVGAYVGVVGVNLRPLPNVALKVQYTAAEVTASPLLSGVLQVVGAQAAWAF